MCEVTVPYCGLYVPKTCITPMEEGIQRSGGTWVMSSRPEDMVFLVFTVNGADLALAQQHTLGFTFKLLRRGSEGPQFNSHPGTQSAVCL